MCHTDTESKKKTIRTKTRIGSPFIPPNQRIIQEANLGIYMTGKFRERPRYCGFVLVDCSRESQQFTCRTAVEQAYSGLQRLNPEVLRGF
jgi:hypothetical protein